jgi:AbiV family abortive infection protein
MQCSASQLAELRREALRNAQEVVRDAELLFEHQRYPRVMSLSILAVEECAKIPIIVAVQELLSRNQTVDWMTFARRFRNHGPKLDLIDFFDFIFGVAGRVFTDVAHFAAELQQRIRNRESQVLFNNAKQWGFYVGMVGGEVRAPDYYGRIESADHLLARARMIAETFARLEGQGPPISPTLSLAEDRNAFLALMDRLLMAAQKGIRTA